LCTELGPGQFYSHRPRVSFRSCIAYPNRGHSLRRCFPTIVHRLRVPTVPRFSAPTWPPSRSPISSASSTSNASPLRSPLHAPHRTPLSTEGRRANQPLRPSPEAAFTATTSGRALHHSSGLPEVAGGSPPPSHVPIMKPLW
jgi:hypothetical protein